MSNCVLYILCVFAAVLIPGISVAQKKVLLKIPAQAKTYEAFIPKGFEVLEEMDGDLNNDGKEDKVLALGDSIAEVQSSDMDTDPRRLLLILFKRDNAYGLACKTDKALMGVHSGTMMGNPLQEFKISNGVLTIHHSGGTSWIWDYLHKFRYQDGSFYLIGRTYDSYWTGKQCDDSYSSENYSDINLATGQMHVRKTSDNCKTLIDKIKKAKVKPLIKLEKFDINADTEG
jgi:hypothetical protein